jgi:hypothetical protein
MSSARQQQYRDRQRAGRVVLFVEVDEVCTEAMLIRAGLLAANQGHSRDTIAEALARMVDKLCEWPA